MRSTTKQILCFMLTAVCCTVPAKSAEPQKISQDELVRRTQALMDAVAAGDQKPFLQYWADDAMFFDEKGRKMDKTALVKDITPLPTGYSGTIKVVNATSRIVGTTAVLSYDMDESETIFGQQVKARYHATDTWLYREGKWQIMAGQVLRYYEDPAAGTVDPSRLDKYVGEYELAPGVTMAVTREADRLFAQRTGRSKDELIPEATDIFFRKGVEGRRLFRFAQDGSVEAMIDRRNNEDVVWKKTK